MQITNAASSIITKLGSINRDVNYAQVSWNSIQSMPYSSSGCVLLFIICLCCAAESQWDQNGTKKNVRVFPPCEFLLKSAYLHCTHIHTALMGNLNATSAPLLFKIPMHQRRNVSAITTKATVQTHPQPTCSSLSAALASSPARVSRRCLTGPSTDNTWASSHRDGYSWWTHNTHTHVQWK